MLLILVMSLAGCGHGRVSPSAPASKGPSSSIPGYSGPIYAEVRGYVTGGRPFDFSHGLTDEQAANAVQVAEEQVNVDNSFEVGLIGVAGSSTKGGDCGQMCAEVGIIDYASAQTHTVLVDLTSSTVARDSVQDTVVAAAGEQGTRELYGVALADPNLAREVGHAFVVQPVVSPFTKENTSCAASSSPPHRCLHGVIYTPSSQVYVYVDLTSASLITWDTKVD